MANYSIRNLSTTPTSRGEAWSCEVLKDGVLIGTAENSGRGGCNNYYFPNRADETDMAAHAKAVLGDEFEVLDTFVVNLTIVAQMNRMRCVAFILDGDDFDTLGQYNKFPARVTVEQAKQALLTNPKSKDKHPKIWDKNVGGFVSIA